MNICHYRLDKWPRSLALRKSRRGLLGRSEASTYTDGEDVG
jgi:hypothetical protein